MDASITISDTRRNSPPGAYIATHTCLGYMEHPLCFRNLERVILQT